LSELYRQLRSFWYHIAWGIGLVTISVLLLSAAGIYAMMSFTVAQRTREIGIRAALGAHPRGLLASIFGRALGQLGLGLLAGSTVSGLVFAMAGLGLAQSAALLAIVAAVMLVVGLFAAIGPARRSLRMHAVEALR
jgi:ABC-type antimicrobial peptide transport system permease subunit